MREEIIKRGGEVQFYTCVDGFEAAADEEGSKVLSALHLRDTQTGERRILGTSLAVLAIGHSARDTFETLYGLGVKMQAKSFAVGVRMEHPQDFINNSQYGENHTTE